MSSAPSKNIEQSSEFPAWIVLVCSGLILLMFFIWIVKDMSALDSPGQEKTPPGQRATAIETLSESWNNAISVSKMADSQATSQTSIIASGTSVERDSDGAAKGSSPISGVPGSSTPKLMQESSDRAAADTPSDATGEVSLASDYAHQAIVESPKLTTPESPQLIEMQNEVASTKEVTDAGTEETFDIPVESGKTVVSHFNSALQLNKVDPASVKPGSDQALPPSADLGALRDLLAEAAAINETETGQLREEREWREAQDSLVLLSEELRFEPGSKIAGASMNAALMQIRKILTDYPATHIEVIVATNESSNDKQDLLLSQERGRTLIANFVKNGLEFSRFSLLAMTDAQLPANSHRVEIRTRSES